MISIANSPGTIDSGYLNDVFIAIRNLSSQKPYRIYEGDKIAQFKLQRLLEYNLEQISMEQFEKLNTERGMGGFGSSDRGEKNVR